MSLTTSVAAGDEMALLIQVGQSRKIEHYLKNTTENIFPYGKRI